jgi:hypothetical protein
MDIRSRRRRRPVDACPHPADAGAGRLRCSVWRKCSQRGFLGVRDGSTRRRLPERNEATMDTHGSGADPIYLKSGIYRTTRWKLARETLSPAED